MCRALTLILIFPPLLLLLLHHYGRSFLQINRASTDTSCPLRRYRLGCEGSAPRRCELNECCRVLQRGRRTHRLLHRAGRHVGHGRVRGRGGHLQLRQDPLLAAHQHDPDGGQVKHSLLSLGPQAAAAITRIIASSLETRRLLSVCLPLPPPLPVVLKSKQRGWFVITPPTPHPQGPMERSLQRLESNG